MAFLKKLGVLLLVLGVIGGVIAAPPVAFNLLTPEDDLLVKRAAGLTFTWSASSDAITYDLYVFRLSDNTRIGEVITDTGLTPAADSDDLTCTAQVCTFTVPASLYANFTDGRYSWTVNAINVDGTTEATNGPLFFTFNSQPIQLVFNGGFEDKDAANLPTLVPWVPAGLTTSRIRCGTGFFNTGNCGFEMRANGGTISQTFNRRLLKEGDTLSLSAAVQTDVIPAGVVASITVRYTVADAGASERGFDRISLTVNTGTTGFDNFSATNLVLDAPVRRAILSVQYAGTTGRVYIDDISAIVTP
ncbi:MAG: hypothetical protein MUF87_17785 [Anaerolineae bacterium]|jgi:hypothetical protein|nr:hypothetical protein [Anaerolineae bacterium]